MLNAQIINQNFDSATDEAIQTLVHGLAGGAEATREVCTWIARMHDRQYEGRSLTAMEHSALTFLLRSRLLDCISNEQQKRNAEIILAKSWLHLTGKHHHILTGRLPRSTLRRADRETRLIHMAAFQPCGPKAAASQKSIGRDYIPELCDFIVIAGLAAIALAGIGKAILGAAAMGYAISTLVEYSMHRWAGHGLGGRFRLLMKKSGWVGHGASNYLEATYLGHFIVHHVKTSNKYYTAQFSSNPSGHRSTIDAELDALGTIGRQIKRTDYGMTLTPTGVVAGLLVTLPIHVTLILILCLEPISAVALMAPSLLHVCASKYLHPYLHKRRDELMNGAGPVVRFLLGTRYAEWISRLHWIHHKGGGGNYNLIPGADFLFGDYRKPNLDLVFRMRADRILGADWRVR
ncbi:MAG TPA: hypothetical protein VK148_19865 [Xanthobacteraceae bacterium]|jgi:hypothetical protein|nr:hypothetical protein [Xanthobacteraceae bacterium]